ncbi:MAG: cupredoxin domain-containing protein [Solirubrobacterales bacterium]
MKKVAFAFALILASFALVACGGGDDDETTNEATTNGGAAAEGGKPGGEGKPSGAATVDFEADPDGALAYTSDTATAEAGKVTVNFTNESPVGHDVAIEDSGGETIGKTDVTTEGSDSTTVELKAGEYKFYCSVPGHREAGMEGTLTVK